MSDRFSPAGVITRREDTQLDRVNRLSARAPPLQDNMSIIIKLGGTTTLLRYRYAY